MNKKFTDEEKAYLKRCKYSSPESKLEWLAAAVEFAEEVKRMRAREKQPKA